MSNSLWHFMEIKLLFRKKLKNGGESITNLKGNMPTSITPTIETMPSGMENSNF